MDKKELRKTALKHQKELNKEIKKEIEHQLTKQLLTTDLWKNAKTIGITMAMEFEWDTRLIIEAGWKEDKVICVPKTVIEDKKLKFYQINSFDELELSTYHLMEPTVASFEIKKSLIDLLVVPGLLFDKQGYRLGFGGGYYDRFLVDFSNETIALCGRNQLVDHLPVDYHDIPVSHLLTENGIIK